MELTFTVMARVARPLAEVFEAVANPAELSRYFTTGGASGRIETGATVHWAFHDFPGAFPVDVVAVTPNRQIVLEWEANEGALSDGEDAVMASAGYKTTVTMTFEALDDGRTLVSITEAGWRETEAITRSHPKSSPLSARRCAWNRRPACSTSAAVRVRCCAHGHAITESAAPVST